MGDKTFNLTWNNHLANLSGLFEGLYKSGSLTDTTLACQGGMLRAHKLVLAACSPYFERVFKEHHGEQPILILKGVPFEEMECLLDFMYRGSINVAEEHLPSLIKTATDLEIRGLSGDERTENDNVHSRVEVAARVRASQIESSIDNFNKMCDNAIAADCIKLEEIEVEDDPMVMEGHEEDGFEESLQSSPSNAKQLIRHVPAPMFKRQIRYEGQKRVSVSHSLNGNDKDNSTTKKMHYDNVFTTRDTLGDDNCDNNSISAMTEDHGMAKDERLSNNLNHDGALTAVHINDDSPIDRDRLERVNSPDSESLDEPETNAARSKKQPMNAESTIKDVTCGQLPISVERKERQPMNKREKSQYKPFTCDLCTLAFTRASHLARHRRVHTGERPFGCSLCPRMFARQDKLKQHLDSHQQWPKRKAMAQGLTGIVGGGSGTGSHAIHLTSGLVGTGAASAAVAAIVGVKGKRGRPRKVNTRTSIVNEHITELRND